MWARVRIQGFTLVFFNIIPAVIVASFTHVTMPWSGGIEKWVKSNKQVLSNEAPASVAARTFLIYANIARKTNKLTINLYSNYFTSSKIIPKDI